jgi:hypothetical protein
VLIASDEGRPVYERLGYVAVERWTVWLRPEHGGGHNVAGNGVCDGGLVIDLSLMNSIRVVPEKGTVRAAGGATIGELDHETQAFGLAAPLPESPVSRSGVDSVGCAASMGSVPIT